MRRYVSKVPNVSPVAQALVPNQSMSTPMADMPSPKVLKRFVKRVPERFEVAAGPASVCGVVIDIDETTGTSRGIARVRADEKG